MSLVIFCELGLKKQPKLLKTFSLPYYSDEDEDSDEVYSDDSEGLDSDQSEGKDWDELEAEAKRADANRGDFSEEEEDDRRKGKNKKSKHSKSAPPAKKRRRQKMALFWAQRPGGHPLKFVKPMFLTDPVKKFYLVYFCIKDLNF